MARIEPLSPDQLSEPLQAELASAEALMGFAPNDLLIMARWPALLDAAKPLVTLLYGPGEIDPTLKRLVATVVSGAAGCRYCQAHTAHGAVKMLGTEPARIREVWSFRSSPLFTDAERAALELAQAAGQQPNAATDQHFVELRKHFTERGILEIVGLIALFGFLNRWNDTLATPLEAAPLGFALQNLRPQDWEPGKHAP